MSNEHSNGHHILPLRTYLNVFFALLALTAITVYTATQFHFGELNLVVAMVIAVIKAALVAAIFMHLFWDNKLYLTVFVGSIVFLGIFITFTMYDTLRRDDIYEEVGKPINPKAEMYSKFPKPDSAAAAEHGH